MAQAGSRAVSDCYNGLLPGNTQQESVRREGHTFEEYIRQPELMDDLGPPHVILFSDEDEDDISEVSLPQFEAKRTAWV